MERVLEVFKEFEGIIGTVFGVVATLVTTKLLESWGKLEYNSSNVEILYLKGDAFGGITDVQTFNEVDYIRCEFRLEVYNRANVIKHLRDIKVLIETNNNLIETDLIDKSAVRFSSGGTISENLKYINFLPKEIVGYDLRFNLAKNNFINGEFERLCGVYLTAMDTKKKKTKILIHKESNIY